MTSRAKVLVLESGKPNALAVIRDLGRHGVPTVAGESFRLTIGGLSRYCTDTLLYPPIETQRARFQEFIIRRASDYEAIFPLADMSTDAVVEILDELKKKTLVAANPSAVYRLALDKAETVKLARREGIPHPKTWIVENEEQLKQLQGEFTYPLVVKSRIGQYWDGRRFTINKVTSDNFARNWEHLLRKYREINRNCPRPLIQEYIEGDGFGYFALVDQGRLVAQFAHHRLREYPISGGSSTLRESVDPGPMQEIGLRLLRAMNWKGVAMLEFKRESRSGEFKLLEVNGRWWGSLPLATASGVHFPWLYYRLLKGEKVEKVTSYETGRRCRLLLPNDLLWLAASLIKSNNRLKVLRDFFDFRDQDFDILSLKDPLPTLGAIWTMARHFGLILAGKETFSGEYR